ncbi:hypothetical protein K2Y00_00730 [Patescibacteria group bacterium]|nr:hypothetical protein [Patescibacteria group bacterium]
MSQAKREAVRYLHADADESGIPHVTCTEGALVYDEQIPQGYAEVTQIQAGACASEFYYYGRRAPETPSRFETDLLNLSKQEYYFARNREAGIPEEHILDAQRVMLRSMFHEGFCRIQAVQFDPTAPRIPLLQFVPALTDGVLGFAKQIINVTLQENLEPGRLAVRNPAYVCSDHSRADTLNPDTGWPHQCDRTQDGGHLAKGTVGHTEFIGTAVAGTIRVPLSGLTPVPKNLSAFVETDIRTRGKLLTLVEPLGCVFDAFGTMLHSGEKPQTVLIFGDGSSALNTVAFLQVHAPDARILVVGKYDDKLESIRTISPEHVQTLCTDGVDMSALPSAVMAHFNSSQAEVVMPTVPIPKEILEPYVKDRGTLIWWTAEVSELAPHPAASTRYRERFPYGGAPHAEFSALALLEYFVTERVNIIDSYLSYSGLYDISLDEAGAKDIEQWLQSNGLLTKTVKTARGEVEMPIKPIIHLT